VHSPHLDAMAEIHKSYQILRRGRRSKQLLNDNKGKRGYCKFKEEARQLDMWRTRFGRHYEPVVRQNTKWINTVRAKCPANLRDSKCNKETNTFNSYKYQYSITHTRIKTNKRHNYTIIVPTKCTRLLKAQDITICTLCLCILSPYMFQPTWAIFRGRNASA
jgi:hypothetical protein